MAQNSSIEWTDHTHNPWLGCTHVSPGCLHCYAETMMDSRYKKVEWGKGKPRIRTSEANWRKPLQWDKQAVLTGRRAKVFCSSLADVFDPEVPDEWRVDLYNLILRTPNLDWLLLTKRPEHVRRMVPGDWLLSSGSLNVLPYSCGWPTNIWIGTSVEDQRRADERIPELLKIPAAVRFLSCEPLLGPIDLGNYLVCDCCDGTGEKFKTIWQGRKSFAGGMAPCPKCNGKVWRGDLHWIIAGAESGAGARPMDEKWVRLLKEQCVDSHTKFFYKQSAVNGHKQPLPELDGRQWLEMPEVSR